MFVSRVEAGLKLLKMDLFTMYFAHCIYLHTDSSVSSSPLPRLSFLLLFSLPQLTSLGSALHSQTGSWLHPSLLEYSNDRLKFSQMQVTSTELTLQNTHLRLSTQVYSKKKKLDFPANYNSWLGTGVPPCMAPYTFHQVKAWRHDVKSRFSSVRTAPCGNTSKHHAGRGRHPHRCQFLLPANANLL